MSVKTRVVLADDALEDLRDLDGSARQLVAKALNKLRTEPEKRGEPLGNKVSTGNLTNLRKLVVGNRDYRIVYEIRQDKTVVVIWVIGKRADEEAYHLAVARIETNGGDQQKKNILHQLIDTAFTPTTTRPKQ